MTDLPPFDRLCLRALLVLGVILACILLTGCLGKDTRTAGTTRTKETTITTPLANGGTIVEREVVTEDQSETRTTTQLEGVGALAAKLGGAAIGAATGTGGLPWELIIAGATTVAAGAFGASKAASAKQLREERDFHKGDADHAYKRLEAKGEA